MKVKLSDPDLGELCSRRLSLTVGVIYPVLGIDDENYRVVNDLLEPVLYGKDIFDVVESTVPGDWINRKYEDGEYHFYPPDFSEVGFFEDYFDGFAPAIEKYNRYLKLNGLERLKRNPD